MDGTHLYSVQVMDLVDKWVAGFVKMRVFTDKWPDCSCAVIFFQEWLSHDLSDWESGMLNSPVAVCIFIRATSISHTLAHIMKHIQSKSVFLWN